MMGWALRARQSVLSMVSTGCRGQLCQQSMAQLDAECRACRRYVQHFIALVHGRLDDASSRIVRWRMDGGITVVLCIVSGSGRKKQNNMPDCKNIVPYPDIGPRPQHPAGPCRAEHDLVDT